MTPENQMINSYRFQAEIIRMLIMLVMLVMVKKIHPLKHFFYNILLMITFLIEVDVILSGVAG